MRAQRTADSQSDTVRLRPYPGEAETGNTLADCEQRYARWHEMHVPVLNWPEVREGSTDWGKAMRKRIGPAPSTSYFTLGQQCTALRSEPAHA